MLRSLALAALMAALASPGPAVAAPAGSPAPPPSFVTATDQTVPIAVMRGGYFMIAIASNPTTGFGWSVARIAPASSATLVGQSYLSNASIRPGTPPMVGVGGVALLLFRAAAPGKATVKLVYSRAWEKTAPVKTATFTLNVR